MSEHIQKTIEEAQSKLRELESEVSKTKQQINWLCGLAGQPSIFADTSAPKSAGATSIRSDQFFGRPLATVAREYLELRKSSGLGAATLDDIYTALTTGGYGFGDSDDDAKRGLAISMAKNTIVFFRLPNGNWGLTEWYPNARREKKTENGHQTTESAHTPAGETDAAKPKRGRPRKTETPVPTE
jgi:hypothetical protein